jgi:hypothetical protein
MLGLGYTTAGIAINIAILFIARLINYIPPPIPSLEEGEESLLPPPARGRLGGGDNCNLFPDEERK